jgi:hypothetical protein
MTSRVLPLPLLLAATLAAGCGGGSGATPSAASAVDPDRAAGVAFATCMRSHDVPSFPDPKFAGGGVQIALGPRSGINPASPAFTKAQVACGSLIGRAGPGGPKGG